MVLYTSRKTKDILGIAIMTLIVVSVIPKDLVILSGIIDKNLEFYKNYVTIPTLFIMTLFMGTITVLIVVFCCYYYNLKFFFVPLVSGIFISIIIEPEALIGAFFLQMVIWILLYINTFFNEIIKGD